MARSSLLVLAACLAAALGFSPAGVPVRQMAVGAPAASSVVMTKCSGGGDGAPKGAQTGGEGEREGGREGEGGGRGEGRERGEGGERKGVHEFSGNGRRGAGSESEIVRMLT